MYRLVFASGPLKGRRLIIRQGHVEIGRDPECTIQIVADDIASRHIVLEQQGSNIYVKRLSVVSSVQVNGKDVRETKLNHGDEIDIGKTRILFQVVQTTEVGHRRRIGKVHSLTFIMVVLILIAQAVIVAGLYLYWKADPLADLVLAEEVEEAQEEEEELSEMERMLIERRAAAGRERVAREMADAARADWMAESAVVDVPDDQPEEPIEAPVDVIEEDEELPIDPVEETGDEVQPVELVTEEETDPTPLAEEGDVAEVERADVVSPMDVMDPGKSIFGSVNELWNVYDLDLPMIEKGGEAMVVPEKSIFKSVNELWNLYAPDLPTLGNIDENDVQGLEEIMEILPDAPDEDEQGDFYTPEDDLHALQATDKSEAKSPVGERPRVLLLGDSISIGYTPVVRKLLEGMVDVRRPEANCGNTQFGLKKLDEWLGDVHWDVIHFNWGLHDLAYRHPEAKVPGRLDKERGQISVPIEDYERNLEEVVARLKQTGAKLIWASTTMVPEGEPGRVVGDAKRYNEVAALVMERHGVPINNLYAVSVEFPPDFWSAPGNVHFKPSGSEALGAAVFDAVRNVLASDDN